MNALKISASANLKICDQFGTVHNRHIPIDGKSTLNQSGFKTIISII
jgi:hypothetical protein